MILLAHELKHAKIWVNLVNMTRHMNFLKQLVYDGYELKMSFQPMDLKFFKIQNMIPSNIIIETFHLQTSN